MAGLQGRILGGYQLAELIGSGGIAEVYRGRSVNSGAREVAIKVIYPEFASQPGFLPNFRRIVEKSNRLVNHPHVLPLLASGEDNGYLYLVTPYVSGGTLREWLLRGGRLGASDVGPFFQQLCGAVAYAHSLGVVHGNIKPTNVFLFEGRHVLLGDFGMLWDIQQIDMNHVGSGTEAVEFLAPEVFQGEITQAADLYSLGAVVFATLVGHAPFSGLKPADIFAAHRHQPVPHLAQADRALAPAILALDPVIQRAMAKRPEERFPAAMQIAQAIELGLQQAPAAPMMGPVPANSPAVQQAWSLGLQTNMLAYPDGAGNPAMPGMMAPASGMPGTPMQVAPPSGSMFAPLDPPFPPLGPSEQADSQMEAGRDDFVLGGTGALASEPTMHIPAPRTLGEASARSANMPDQLTMRVPASPGQNPNGGSGANGPMGYGGAEQHPWAPSSSSPPGGAAAESWWPGAQDASAQQAQRMPAIRLDPPDAPLGDDQYDPAGASRADYSGALGWNASVAPAARASAGYGESQEYPAAYERRPGSAQGANAPFSPTELGLPRLTMPELPDIGPEYAGGQASYAGGYSSEYAAVPNGRYAETRDPGARAGGAQGEWSQGPSGEWSAQYPAYGTSDAHSGWQNSEYEAQMDESFTAQRVWTNGRTAVRARRRRRARNLLMLAVVLLALVGATGIVYARPDLCPLAQCESLSALAHRYVPSVDGYGALPAQSFAVTAGGDKIAVVVGKSATSTVTLSNPNTTTQEWQAASDFAWLAVTPTDGTLAPGSSVTLTISAKPVAVPPGTYSANVTILNGAARTTVPVTIVVSAGARLAVTPSELTFTSCETAKTLTISNDGDAFLSFQATPSVSAALTLTTSAASIAPGGSASVVATMSCQAAVGELYAIILTSNGGSVQVPVHYGS